MSGIGVKKVGRKRIPQPKDIAKTMAGRFGAHLLQLSENAGLTAEEFAEKIGKSKQTVFGYFSGAASPHINDWPVIAKALGVPVKDLIPE